MSMPEYPYTNFHELNLDWLIEQVKKSYSPDNPPPVGEVMSVNGMTGEVVLYTDADVRLPTVEDDDWNIRRYVSGNMTLGIYFQKNGPMQRMNGGSRYNVYDENNPPPYPVTSVNGQTGAITGVYTADNPPAYPVTSVNGQTGAVVINVPVDSVNGQTGAVVIPVAFKNNNSAFLMPTQDLTGSEWGLERKLAAGTAGISFEIENGHVVGYLNFYDNQDQVIDQLKILTPADIPSSTGVVSVNGMTGVVTGLYDANNPPPYPVTSVNGNTGAVALTGSTIPTSTTNNRPISETIETAYENTMEDIAIVIIGNKTLNSAGAAIGQYVVVRDSTIENCPDGLYKAIQTIPYNTVITAAYLSTRITGGVANSLNTEVSNKSSIKTKTFNMESAADNIRLENYGVSRSNFINAFVTSTNNIACVPYAYSTYGYLRFINSSTMQVSSGTYSGVIIYYE